MILMSRLEVNVKRLLGRCELMAKEDSSQNNWRLEKYIYALDDMIKKLEASPIKPTKEAMMEYTRRVDFLKGVVGTAKLSNPVERVAAVQLLSKTPAAIASESAGANIATQIHQKTSAKYNRDLRAELFKTDPGSSEDGLRRRLPMNSTAKHDDLDALVKYNRNIQEKIAESMISITSNMKDDALTARAIIRKDVSVLEKSDKLTEANTAKLKAESLKLEEHSKSNWRCWVWVMVVLVLVVFFNMVLFMKVAKKRV